MTEAEFTAVQRRYIDAYNTRAVAYHEHTFGGPPEVWWSSDDAYRVAERAYKLAIAQRRGQER